MNKYIKCALISAAVISSVACTADFENLNTDPFAPTPDQMMGDNALTTSHLQSMMTALMQIQQNNSQYIEQFVGGEYGGMVTPPIQYGGEYAYSTYNPTLGNCGQVFDIIMPQIYTGLFQISNLSNGEGSVYGIALIIRVAASLKISDCYGPIPYSKITGADYTVAYDDMPQLYEAMFADLNKAIGILTPLASTVDASLAEGDTVFGGDYGKWVKFANTLKLRMAMRISNATADPVLARRMAEEAVMHSVGVMTEASDSAWTSENDGMNPLYRAAFVWDDGKDLRISANITTYMNGYNDPRLPLYATKAEYASVKDRYVGVRSGIELGNAAATKDTYQKLSNINLQENSPQLIMSAAEAWFLRAEGALNGWSMGDTAKNCYEKGVTVSMSERGAAIGDYLSSQKTPSSYVDPISNLSAAAPSTVYPYYNESQSAEVNRERIMIQKWLANFPNGWETWADRRRTGYPRLLTVVKNNAPSSDNVSSSRGMRRLRYPQSEYTSNAENLQAAVMMLGGSDTFGTDLWWAKKN